MCFVFSFAKDGGRKDMPVSDISPTIGCMSHTLIASTLITHLTFKAILKELVSLATNYHSL